MMFVVYVSVSIRVIIHHCHGNLELPSWSVGVSYDVCSVLVFITVMVI